MTAKKTSAKVGFSALVYELPAVALEILFPLILSINFIFTNILYPCQHSIYILPSTILLHFKKNLFPVLWGVLIGKPLIS